MVQTSNVRFIIAHKTKTDRRNNFNLKIVVIYCDKQAKSFPKCYRVILNKISGNFFVHCCYGNPCSNWSSFPPKDLEKYGRPKYACAIFSLIFHNHHLIIINIFNCEVMVILINSNKSTKYLLFSISLYLFFLT